VLLDKTASYILFEISAYINILALEMASPGNRQCANLYRHTFVPIGNLCKTAAPIKVPF